VRQEEEAINHLDKLAKKVQIADRKFGGRKKRLKNGTGNKNRFYQSLRELNRKEKLLAAAQSEFSGSQYLTEDDSLEKGNKNFPSFVTSSNAAKKRRSGALNGSS
jgi:hypothetical protein